MQNSYGHSSISNSGAFLASSRICNYLIVALAYLIFASPASAGTDDDQALIAAQLAKPEITIANETIQTDDIRRFYTVLDNRPQWVMSAHENQAEFKRFLDSIQDVITYHGLDDADYPLDTIRRLAASEESQDRMDTELLTTDTLLKLAYDLHGEGENLQKIYLGWPFHRAELDTPSALATAAASGKIGDFFKTLPPQRADYLDLAKALHLYRQIESEGGWKPITPGPTLRPGDINPRVTEVRQRLKAEHYALAEPKEPEKFDDSLHDAIAFYQKRNGLQADGSLGLRTLQALNVPLAIRIEQIRANMMRWRHMPNDFPGTRYALINLPDYTLKLHVDADHSYEGPVVDGRPDRPSPFIASEIRSVLVNPSWHVPRKIARKDILPKLQKDPHFLEKMGFVIAGHSDDPFGETVDWKHMKPEEFNLTLRQQPGDQNSLGSLKFDFNNEFAVYMHGTPHMELFAKPQRAFSSGCVRLRDPVPVAEMILSGNKEPWDEARLNESIATGKTKWIGVGKPLPIYFVYFTVFNDSEGNLNFRKDIYDFDHYPMVVEEAKPTP